jgi:hypothetical protein
MELIILSFIFCSPCGANGKEPLSLRPYGAASHTGYFSYQLPKTVQANWIRKNKSLHYFTPCNPAPGPSQGFETSEPVLAVLYPWLRERRITDGAH